MASSGRKNADDLLAVTLAAGKTVGESAQAAGVSPRTVDRRLQDPEFRKRLSRLRGEMVSRALGKLTDTTAAAADALKCLLSADSETVRLGAAKAILELGLKIRESVELEDRLRALEMVTEVRLNSDIST